MSNKVIMEDALFYATDAYGDGDQQQDTGHGLYMDDTRFLSQHQLQINGERPELLGSGSTESYMLTTLLKHELKDVGAVEVKRSSLLYNRRLYERLDITNYFLQEQLITISLQFDADFQDMFLVRKYRTGDVGERLETIYEEQSMCLQYLGKDEQLRQTLITWTGQPTVNQQEQRLEYELKLAPGQQHDIELIIVPKLGAIRLQRDAGSSKSGSFEVASAEAKSQEAASHDAASAEATSHEAASHDAGSAEATSHEAASHDAATAEATSHEAAESFAEALACLRRSYDQWFSNNTRITSSSALFNGLIARSMQDMRMLRRDIGHGSTMVAGLPWFATVFGRDSLITSLFMLPLHSNHALGTLRTLAAFQAKVDNPWRDEERGKIMHEIRFGELVQTGQSPFSPYYGGVDSTPLFLVLLVEYVKWSGDTAIVSELSSIIEQALEWIDRRCQSNHAGFLTYKQEADQGFPNQGWKDSANSIVNEDGTLAIAPIALIEVQGYISYAKLGLAEIYTSLGQDELGQRLKQQAEHMARQIEHYFWLEQEQYLSIALDGDLKPVHSITSNPGHLLLLDILQKPYAEAIAKRLLASDLYNGWGIRTMSSQSTGYYPISYHNGSVWPHDNGMILLGFVKSGLFQHARELVAGLLAVADQVPQQRFPELFCGYSRAEYEALIPYPTTCSPQAWSGATTFVMVQAMLGLQVNVLRREVRLAPALPLEVREMTVHGLTIGGGSLDIQLKLDPNTELTQATILHNTTGLEVVILTK